MSNQKRLSVRLNLERLDHQKAWQILQELPQGRRNEYITGAVIDAADKRALKKLIAETLREVLAGNTITQNQPNKRNAEPDKDALHFIKNL